LGECFISVPVQLEAMWACLTARPLEGEAGESLPKEGGSANA
jgi:hypothetical protein